MESVVAQRVLGAGHLCHCALEVTGTGQRAGVLQERLPAGGTATSLRMSVKPSRVEKFKEAEIVTSL